MISGSIRLDPKSGVWRARYRLPGDGKHYSWTPRPQPRTQREASRLLAEHLMSLEEGREVGFARDTVAALAQRWFAARKVNWSGTTPRLYAGLLRARIVPALGAVRAQQLTVEQVEGWRDTWLQELDRTTVSRLLWVLSRVLQLGVERGLLRTNVAKLAVWPKAQHPERVIPAIEWVEAELLPRLRRRGELAWPFLVLYETGLRSGELRALRKADVNLDRRLLHVRQSVYFNEQGTPVAKAPKTRASERAVPLTERAHALLRQQIARTARRQLRDRLWTDNGLVFPGRHGLAMHGSTLLAAWRQLQQEAGIPMEGQVTVHDLRHLANTAMERLGIPAERRAKILGHTKVQITTSVYTHYDEEALLEVAQAINKGRRRRNVPGSVPMAASEGGA